MNACKLTATCSLYIVCLKFAGTHDVQNISVTSVVPGELEVSGYLLQHGIAGGLLVMLYSLDLNGNNDRYFQVVRRSETDNNIVSAKYQGLTGGHYGVSVFILEENGLPFGRSAVSPKVVDIKHNTGE